MPLSTNPSSCANLARWRPSISILKNGVSMCSPFPVPLQISKCIRLFFSPMIVSCPWIYPTVDIYPMDINLVRRKSARRRFILNPCPISSIRRLGRLITINWRPTVGCFDRKYSSQVPRHILVSLIIIVCVILQMGYVSREWGCFVFHRSQVGNLRYVVT